MAGKASWLSNLNYKILYTYINIVLIILYQNRFHQTNVEICNFYLFVEKKNLKRRIFCNAGADEKPPIYFAWPNGEVNAYHVLYNV